MASLESTVTTQPVVKDVQTLKANLKEQEKRARSESEAQEVIPDATKPQPAADEEQRKRQKTDNPTDPKHHDNIEITVLDGPLPPIKDHAKSTPRPSAPSKNLASPVVQQKDAASSTSPSKVADPTELPKSPVKPVANAPATAQGELSNGNPEAVPSAVESPKKPAPANNGSNTDDPKPTEDAKETTTAVPESKEPATTSEEPVVTAEKATSS